MIKASSDGLRYCETRDVPGCVRPSLCMLLPPATACVGVVGGGSLDEMHAHTGSS